MDIDGTVQQSRELLPAARLSHSMEARRFVCSMSDAVVVLTIQYRRERRLPSCSAHRLFGSRVIPLEKYGGTLSSLSTVMIRYCGTLDAESTHD